MTKCLQCGCMRETLETLRAAWASSGDAADHELAEQASAWLARMMPIRYASLGCEHCFPAVALDALSEGGVVDVAGPACAWKPLLGDHSGCEAQGFVVEHYAYDNQLLHVIEGTASRDIYCLNIDVGCVSQLSHAAYLGKELAAAELSLRHGFADVQDAT